MSIVYHDRLFLAVGNFLLNNKLRVKVSHWLGSKRKQHAFVIPRDEHHLSRKNISPNALKVLYRLKKSGYEAYLVGGGVRDLLLDRVPKDFDVATNARPEELRTLFVNSRIIGRRFRILHVFYQGEIIEVTTFRANAQDEEDAESDEQPAMITADNTYGTIEEDAWRRDFTVNALYYNIADFSVVDYTDGMADLKQHTIRMIGDPVQRYHEDPVRLLRALRLAAKLNFKIHPDTETPIKILSHLLQHVPQSRLFDELLKIFFDGNAEASFRYLCRYDYVRVFFPDFLLDSSHIRFVKLGMQATDERFQDGRSLNPGFLLSVILWPIVLAEMKQQESKSEHIYQALHHAIDTVLTNQNATLRIPRRFTVMMRSVWVMQFQLLRLRGKRVYRTLRHRYFRASYDFLALRVQAGEPYKKELLWWTDFQKVNPTKQKKMVDALTRKSGTQ